MGYRAPTKNSNKFSIKMVSNTGDNINENFTFTKTIAEVTDDTILASKLDTFAREFTDLSTNTYNDSKIQTVKCMESIVGGE